VGVVGGAALAEGCQALYRDEPIKVSVVFVIRGSYQ